MRKQEELKPKQSPYAIPTLSLAVSILLALALIPMTFHGGGGSRFHENPAAVHLSPTDFVQRLRGAPNTPVGVAVVEWDEGTIRGTFSNGTEFDSKVGTMGNSPYARDILQLIDEKNVHVWYTDPIWAIPVGPILYGFLQLLIILALFIYYRRHPMQLPRKQSRQYW
jgi:hypothetical protein